MTIWLRQSTAKTVLMGPFVDDTDGKTAETALSITQADIRLSKNGGDVAQSNNSTGATHDESGFYDVPLDSTDTGTLGTLRVFVYKSGALPVWQDFMVVPQKIYDSLISGSDNLEADTILWNGLSLPTIPSAAPTVGEIRTELATELGRVDVAISSRLAAIGYVAPDNAGIAALPTLSEIEASEVLAKVADLPTAEAIRVEMDDHSTQLAAIASSGSNPTGSVAWTYIVTDSVSHNPISGATVEAYSDAACTNLVRSAISDGSGIATFRLIPGTYHILVIADGYDVPDADMEVVS